MVDELTVRPDECARLLGIGRSKMYELIRSGEVPAIRIGRSVRIPVDQLRAWINERAAVAANDNGSKERGTDAEITRPVSRPA